MEEFILNTKTKYYNGWLINKEKELGMTSTEMASYLGISISYYSNIRAMRTYPKKSMIMGKICDKLGLDFDDTFPKWLDDNFIIKRDTVSEKEYKVNRISIENVKREELVSGNYDLEDEVAKKILEEDVKKVLNTLDKRDRKVLEMRFGLNNYERTTLEEVARKLNVTRERVRQIEARALRRLRHPSRRIYLQQNNY